MKINSTSHHHPAHARRRKIKKIPLGAQRFLAVLEGIEGGFAISTSIVAGLHFSNMPQHLLIITILVSNLVHAFNTASVKYSTEHYLDEIDGHEKKSAFKHYFIPALIEFGIYLCISMMAIVPLLVIPNITIAILTLVLTNLAILFAAGWWRGYVLCMHPLRDAIETCLLGTGIILAGALSGWILYGF